MLSDQCISVTDLRVHTKDCLENLVDAPKYIFVSNKPVAVLLDIQVYEANFLLPQLIELPHDQVSDVLLAKAKKAENSKRKDLINIGEL